MSDIALGKWLTNLRRSGLLAVSLIAPSAHAAPPQGFAERATNGAVDLRWTSNDPVDVLVASGPDMPAAKAELVVTADTDGMAQIETPLPRPYLLLRNSRTGETTRLAERLVPLERGSNFRDLGGYPVAGGRHVRWGLIYRSGATPLLSDADVARLKGLNLAEMVDLRSDEERVLAPSRIDGVRYTAIGYSMAQLGFGGGMEAGYRAMPKMLAPQLRLIFGELLRHPGPIAFNCSAGQDRTGFTAAMILSALGAAPATVLEDYHLSTRYRRPEFEMPRISDAQAAANPVAAMFKSYQGLPNAQPQPLKTADGRAYLSFALDEINQRWGSVEGYLKSELGLSQKDIQQLRRLYTQ